MEGPEFQPKLCLGHARGSYNETLKYSSRVGVPLKSFLVHLVVQEILKKNCIKGHIDAAKERWDLRSIKKVIYQCNQTVADEKEML